MNMQAERTQRSQRVLVLGAGSIGRRHMRNLRALGIQDIAACDPDPTRVAPMVDELSVRPFAEFQAALASFSPEAVFICTPPSLHVNQALEAIQAGAHVFLEKPLSDTLDGVDELLQEAKGRDRIIQVGYHLRFNAGLQQLKKLVEDKMIGRVLWASAEFGQYLPDWRPWQDYRRSYTAQRSLGGGILLDASHEIDAVIWLLGVPILVRCLAGKVSSLDMDVEDCATILLEFASGARADIHVDCVQRAYARSCKVAGEQGTIVWDEVAHEVRLYQAQRGCWETSPYTTDVNEMYVKEVQQFLACVRQGTMPSVSLEDAKTALQVVLAAKAAAEQGSLAISPVT